MIRERDASEGKSLALTSQVVSAASTLGEMDRAAWLEGESREIVEEGGIGPIPRRSKKRRLVLR